MAKLALPDHFTSVSPPRIVQKNCQNKKREIEEIPLENCSFLMIAYFHHCFPCGCGFNPMKKGDKAVNLHYVLHYVFGEICGRYGIWNPEKGKLSNTHLLEYSFSVCRKSFRISNIFSPVTFKHKILSKKSQKFRSLSLI